MGDGQAELLLHMTGIEQKGLLCAGMEVQSSGSETGSDYWFCYSASRPWARGEILGIGFLGIEV